MQAQGFVYVVQDRGGEHPQNRSEPLHRDGLAVEQDVISPRGTKLDVLVSSLDELRGVLRTAMLSDGQGWDGVAKESNLPSVGLPRLTGFEDRLGHRPQPLQECLRVR